MQPLSDLHFTGHDGTCIPCRGNQVTPDVMIVYPYINGRYRLTEVPRANRYDLHFAELCGAARLLNSKGGR